MDKDLFDIIDEIFYREMSRIRDMMKRIFREVERVRKVDIFTEPSFKDLLFKKEIRIPETRYEETDKAYVMYIELPGIKKQDIDIEVYDNFIEIKAETKQKLEKEDKEKYSLQESVFKFYKKIPIPSDVDKDKIMAKYENGLLTIVLPKIKKGGRKLKIQ